VTLNETNAYSPEDPWDAPGGQVYVIFTMAHMDINARRNILLGVLAIGDDYDTDINLVIDRKRTEKAQKFGHSFHIYEEVHIY
jgi:hypothetical protein